MKLLFATDFEILRGVQANGMISLPMERKPVRIGTLLDEQGFGDSGSAMIHNQTVFLEDQHHDWSWQDGQFRYYTRIAERADIVVAYAVEIRVIEDKPQDKHVPNQ